MIGWYVHHVGRGHVTRAASVAAHLGEPVTGLGSMPAPDGWPGAWVQLERDDAGVPHPPAADVTARGTLHWVPRHDVGLAERHARLTAWLAREQPRLVVVDVSVEVAVQVRLCGVPVAVVALPGRRLDAPHRLAYDLADLLVAPWPEGTHTDGWPRHWLDKTVAVGGLSRFDGLAPLLDAAPAAAPAPDAPRPGRRRVLVVWGAGGRTSVEQDLAPARAATPGWEWVVRSPQSPSPDLWRELAEADVVVTHAGQNAVAEVAASRRPAVVVAEPRPFDEQVATARAVERLGIAVGVDRWPEATEWDGLLERAVALGGRGWSRWTTGDAARVVARHLDVLASRADGPPAGAVA